MDQPIQSCVERWSEVGLSDGGRAIFGKPTVFNPAAVEALKRDVGTEFTISLIADCLHDLPSRVECLCAGGEAEDLSRQAHALVSVAAYLGLEELSATARALSKALRMNGAAPDLMDELPSVAERAFSALRAAMQTAE